MSAAASANVILFIDLLLIVNLSAGRRKLLATKAEDSAARALGRVKLSNVLAERAARLFLQLLLARRAKTCRGYFSVFSVVTDWVRNKNLLALQALVWDSDTPLSAPICVLPQQSGHRYGCNSGRLGLRWSQRWR